MVSSLIARRMFSKSPRHFARLFLFGIIFGTRPGVRVRTVCFCLLRAPIITHALMSHTGVCCASRDVHAVPSLCIILHTSYHICKDHIAFLNKNTLIDFITLSSWVLSTCRVSLGLRNIDFVKINFKISFFKNNSILKEISKPNGPFILLPTLILFQTLLNCGIRTIFSFSQFYNRSFHSVRQSKSDSKMG